MKRWYPRVYSADLTTDNDLVVAIDAADAYFDEYEIARGDLQIKGKLEQVAAKLPGLVEQRFAQLQDIEAILEHLETRHKKKLIGKTKDFLEHYQRTLSDRMAKDYAEVSDDVQLVLSVIQRIAFVRNLYLGIHKGLETLQFQLNNVTKLKVAGIEDAEIGYNRD